MLDDDDGGTADDETLEHPEESVHVEGMQSDGRLVQHEQGVVLISVDVGGQLEPLCLATGKGGGRFTEGEIPEAEVREHPEPVVDLLEVGEFGKGLFDGEPEHRG
ncbi:hypothetical protein [Rhodococcus sp. (in: high G+C Gram-positive bacteria)]|uniref:hypothetical protein n=1 Tax=Rhodococcus sp. TaxID=1831 RepID=UPI00388E5A40